jgi:hypothetical protein
MEEGEDEDQCLELGLDEVDMSSIDNCPGPGITA